MTENAIAKEIVDAAFRIHTTLGPGLLESVYQTVLAYELGRRGLRAVSQQAIPVVYDGIRIDTGFRADLVVEDKVIVEIKWVRLLWNDGQLSWNHRVGLIESGFDVDLEPDYENNPGASAATGYLDWASSACSLSTV